MMDKPLVSIVIPCYNAVKYVGEAIRSALAQTYPNVEVIVIDDGSTDGSLNVIKSFHEAIRWESGPNRGGCAARNRGIELARGELIQFLDADDFLHPAKLEVQVIAAIQHRPAVPICDYEIIDLKGRRHLMVTACDTNDPIVHVARRTISISSPLHWRELLVSVDGFREGLPCWQEDDLYLRLACAGVSFFHVPQPLFTWRHVPGSIVTGGWTRVVEYSRRIYCPIYRRLKRTGTLTDERALALGAAVARYAYCYLDLGMMVHGKAMLRRAFRMHPDAVRDATRSVYRRWFYKAAYRVSGPLGVIRLKHLIHAPLTVARALIHRLSQRFSRKANSDC